MRTTITVGHVLGFFDRLAATINRAPKDGVRICHVHVEERVHRPPTDGRADHQERVADAKLRGALRVEMTRRTTVLVQRELESQSCPE